MADFQSQAMGLTGLTIDASSTAPSRAEFSTFLNDGVIDVTNRVIRLRPQDIEDFLRESAETESNASLDINGAKILSVVREDGVTSDNWRPCRKVSPSQQYLVTDVNSLHFSSKFYPSYMVGDNGLVSVFPAPGADPNAFKVYYVNNAPVETDGTALDHASTGIKYFPNDKVYLVILYSGIKSLQSALSAVDISTFSLSSVSPVAPDLATVSFSETNALSISASVPGTPSDPSISSPGVATVAKADISGDVPTYSKPTITTKVSFDTFYEDTSSSNPFGDNDPGALSITAVAPAVPTISSQVISDPSSFAPAYTKPVLSLSAAPTISDLSITTAVPVAPAISSQAIVDPSSFAPAYTKPVLSLATVPTISDLTISAISPVSPSGPSFTAPDISGIFNPASSPPSYVAPVISLGTAPTISDLSISAVSPVTPSLTSVTFTSIDSALDANAPVFTTAAISASSTYTGSAPAYTKPVLLLGTAPTISDLSISAVSPVTPSLTQVTFTSIDSALDANASVFSTATISTASTYTGSAPAYTKPTLVLGTAPTISNLSITAVPPDVPTLSSITFSSIDSAVDSTLTVVAAGGTLGSASVPTYSPPGHPAQEAFASYWTVGDFGDSDPGSLSITAVPPATPSLPSITSPGVSSVTLSNVGVPPIYTAPVVGGATEEITNTMTATTADGYGTDADFLDFSMWFTTVGELIEDEEDTELAQVQLQKISAYIQAYSGAMQNQLNVFNDANAEYQGKLQEAIQQAQINAQEAQKEGDLTFQASIQDYTLELQKYQADVGKYQAEVAQQVQEYTQKLSRYQLELNTVYQAWAKTESDNLQVFQLDIQNELNQFNMENVKYQASVQESMAEFQSQNQMNIANAERSQNRQLQNSINDMKVLFDSNAQSIQKYSAELQQYQAEVAMEVQEYQQNLAGDLQVWQTERQTDLQKYASDIQNELNEFNKENVAYQSAIQESVQELQVTNQVNLAKAQADLQLATTNKDRDQQRQLQNGVNDMQAIVQDNTRKITLYQAEVGTYQAEIGKEVQEYQQNLAGDIQVWQAERQTDLQKYNTDVQNEVNEFNKENVAYQSAIQESIQELQVANGVNLAKAQADLQLATTNKDRDQQRQLQNGINDMQAIVQDNNRKVALYQAEVGTYQAEIGKEVQQYQQNLAGDLQVWQAERTTDLQKYGSDIQNALNTFNKDNVEYQAQLQQATQEVGLVLQKENQEYAAELQKYTAEVQNYQADVAKEVQEYQQNLAGDIQVWQAERQTDLQKYGTDVQNELNEFNKENVKYQAIVQEYIQEAQLLDAHEARKLQKYQAEIGTYSADVNTQVQEYQQNLQGDLQVWQTERQTDLQQYGSDLQNELNEFNKENAKYQAILQEYVQEAQLLDAHEARKIQKYQAESQTYQLDVNKQVQEYTQKLSRYQLEMSTSYQAWAKVESDSIAIYQADIQNELNEFNKENARYQANIQAEIAKFQVDAAEAQKEGDLTLQAAIQDYTQELSLFSGEIQKYQAQVNKEVQEYTTQLQSDVQTMQGKIANNQALLTKYQAETADYQIEIAAEIQAYQQEIAEKTAEYQWQTARLQDLKQEYDQAFAIMAPAPQQQPQQQVAQRRR